MAHEPISEAAAAHETFPSSSPAEESLDLLCGSKHNGADELSHRHALPLGRLLD